MRSFEASIIIYGIIGIIVSSCIATDEADGSDGAETSPSTGRSRRVRSSEPVAASR